MNLLHEFREPEVITKATEEVRRRAIRFAAIESWKYAVDTHAICSFGLKGALLATRLFSRTEESASKLPWQYRASTPWK